MQHMDKRSESRIRPTSSHIVGDIAEEEPVPEAYKDAVLRDESTLKAGWLAKKGKRGGKWKRRWFVLRPDKVAYYKNEREYQTLRIIPTFDINTVTSVGKTKRPNVFALYTDSRTFYLQADTHADSEQWIERVTQAIHATQSTTPDLSATPTGQPQVSVTLHSPRPLYSKIARSAHRSADIAIPTSDSYLSSSDLGMSSPHLQGHELGTSADSRMGYFSGLEVSGIGTSVSSMNSDISRPNSPAALASPSFPGHTSALHTVGSRTLDYPYQTQPQQLTSQQADTDRPDGAAKVEYDMQGHQVVTQSYLLRLHGRPRQWKRRWAVLRHNQLALYKSEMEYQPTNIISADQIIDVFETDALSKSKKHCFQMITQQKPYRFCATNDEAVDKWIGAVQTVIKRAKEKERERLREAGIGS